MYLITQGEFFNNPKNTKESVLLPKFDYTNDGMIIDVRMSKDNKVVLSETDLIYNNYYISRMNYKDIMKLKFASRTNRYYIPLLEEVLKKYKKEVLVINLHHNYDQNDLYIKEIKRILNKYPKINYAIIPDDNIYKYALLLNYPLILKSNLMTINITTININSEIKYKINIENDKYTMLNNEVYVITNNSRLLRKYYL